MLRVPKPKALEFFAGGGLARLGLACAFNTIWANDIDPAKAASWVENFGETAFAFGDVHDLSAEAIPSADLAWASFPCQDLSLAGDRSGLNAPRSGAFYGFTRIIGDLKTAGRAPKVLVLENVSGLLTSHGGRDFEAVLQVLADLGYRAGALEIDARLFVPQSRVRVFIVAFRHGVVPAPDLIAPALVAPLPSPFFTPALARAWDALPPHLRAIHIKWNLAVPPQRNVQLGEIIDQNDQNWWPDHKSEAIIACFSPRHRQMLEFIQRSGTPSIGTIYRRTRTKSGIKRTFAEPRFDGVAGCLRTPGGGSSRQFWIFITGSKVCIRPINPREAMRLMGVSDTYILPKGKLAGLKIAGDGVAVPVVSWLARGLLADLANAPQNH